MEFGLRWTGLAFGLLSFAGAQILSAQTPAEKLIEAGHWKRARTIVEARMREHPDALAHYLLSQIRNAFGDRESPGPLAERAVALDGSVAKYHRQLAEVLGVKAQHAGIVQQLLLARRFKKEIDTAIALDPRDLQALRDSMEFYLLAPAIAGGDRTKAQAVVRQIARISPAEGYSAEARLAGASNEANRIEGFLRKAIEAEPANYKARIALAEYYLSAGPVNPGAAEQQALEAMKLDRSRVDAYSVSARVYAVRGQWASLDALLVTSEQQVPDDLAPSYRAAVTLIESNSALDRAATYLQKYLKAAPEGNAPTVSEARWRLGLAMEKIGRYQDAVREWRESVRVDHSSPAAQDLKRVKNPQ